MNTATHNHPIALLLTMAEHAQHRVRQVALLGQMVDEHIVQLQLERAGTAYRTTLAMGQGAAAGLAAASKARLLKRGTQVVLHADGERIRAGKRPHIELTGTSFVQPIHLRTAHWAETEREAA